MSKTHRLRWFQFSLRALLLLTAAVAIASPWWRPAADELFFPSEQTLPSTWSGPFEDIEYFPSAEFKDARQAAADKAYLDEQAVTRVREISPLVHDKETLPDPSPR